MNITNKGQIPDQEFSPTSDQAKAAIEIGIIIQNISSIREDLLNIDNLFGKGNLKKMTHRISETLENCKDIQGIFKSENVISDNPAINLEVPIGNLDSRMKKLQNLKEPAKPGFISHLLYNFFKYETQTLKTHNKYCDNVKDYAIDLSADYLTIFSKMDEIKDNMDKGIISEDINRKIVEKLNSGLPTKPTNETKPHSAKKHGHIQVLKDAHQERMPHEKITHPSYAKRTRETAKKKEGKIRH